MMYSLGCVSVCIAPFASCMHEMSASRLRILLITSVLFGAFAYHPRSSILALVFFFHLINLCLMFPRDCVSFGELFICFVSVV